MKHILVGGERSDQSWVILKSDTEQLPQNFYKESNFSTNCQMVIKDKKFKLFQNSSASSC